MHILIVGASGFLGRALTVALLGAGHHLHAACRHPQEEAPGPRLAWIPCDLRQDSQEDWLARLLEVDLVINAAGILQETPDNGFAAVHDRGPRALLGACQAGGIRYLQISAIGADLPTPPTEFLASKRRADRAVLQGGSPHSSPGVVLYPGIVLGPEGRSTRLFLALAALPVHLCPSGAGRLPVTSLGTLCGAVLALLDDWPAKGEGEGEGRPLVEGWLTVAELLDGLRAWLGLPPAPRLALPEGPVAALLRLCPIRLGPLDAAGFSLYRTLASHYTPAGTATAGAAAASVPGGGLAPAPGPLAPAIPAIPAIPALMGAPRASQATRAAAQTFFLPTLGLASLVFLWLASGLLSAFVAKPVGDALLAGVGIHGTAADFLIYAGATLDCLLGAALLWPRWRRRALGLQGAVMVFYCLAIAWLLPALWLHPLGPVSKNLPLLVLTLWLYRLAPAHPR
jgi:nucleoside-diphosphate-sugar epimerase